MGRKTQLVSASPQQTHFLKGHSQSLCLAVNTLARQYSAHVGKGQATGTPRHSGTLSNNSYGTDSHATGTATQKRNCNSNDLLTGSILGQGPSTFAHQVTVGTRTSEYGS